MYSDKVIEHFKNPHNMGEMKNPDAIGRVGNPMCGDIMVIYIKIKNNKITDIKFETMGCVAAIATSSMITELAKGKTLEQAMKISFKDIVNQLGELPPIKMHCADLAVRGLRKAIKNYKLKERKKKKIKD